MPDDQPGVRKPTRLEGFWWIRITGVESFVGHSKAGKRLDDIGHVYAGDGEQWLRTLTTGYGGVSVTYEDIEWVVYLGRTITEFLPIVDRTSPGGAHPAVLSKFRNVGDRLFGPIVMPWPNKGS